MRISEVELDHAFADTLETDQVFQHWLLAGSRFGRFADTARLLHEEQSRVRKAKHWWKHWWIKLNDGTESETDLFAVFEAPGGLRFAFHIENKPFDGKLTFDQAAAYRRRAIQCARTPKWLHYHDLETVLIAPRGFIDRYQDCSAQFDRALSYDEISAFVPLFGAASFAAA
ncbi:MAG: hypothetical protein ACT6QU_19075 [Aliihoeflea sp.]